ncbi:MAG: hypothetical protein OXF32_06550 [Anaerolineaceae bacterium]|nr:hypothetical protein [Anaerolineaceae bacterium]
MVDDTTDRVLPVADTAFTDAGNALISVNSHEKTVFFLPFQTGQTSIAVIFMPRSLPQVGRSIASCKVAAAIGNIASRGWQSRLFPGWFGLNLARFLPGRRSPMGGHEEATARAQVN